MTQTHVVRVHILSFISVDYAVWLSIVCVWQTCYDWFCHGIADLESDTQSQLFQKEILKLDLNKLTPTGRQLFVDVFLLSVVTNTYADFLISSVLWNAVAVSSALLCLLLCVGFACFKCFFENVNQNENKLKKTSNIMVSDTCCKCIEYYSFLPVW